MEFEKLTDTGKFRLLRAVTAADEEVIPFDNRRFMRVNRKWELYDYTTGIDAPEKGHRVGLDELIAFYNLHQTQRGKGLKLHVVGIASTFKRGVFDNDALARRRAANVVRKLREGGVAAEDIAAPQAVVLGDATGNDKNDRAVRISTGLAASSEFSMFFLFMNPTKVADVLIMDTSWKLFTSFRVLPQSGTMDLERALPTGNQPGLLIQTGVGGVASDKQSKISLFSLDPTLMKFNNLAGFTQVSGVTFREQVKYAGTGPGNPGPGVPDLLQGEEDMTAFLMRKDEVRSL